MELSVQDLLKIPAIRQALAQQDIDADQQLTSSRAAILDELAALQEPIAEATKAEESARIAFEAAKKKMEIERGKLGNVIRQLSELNARSVNIHSRLNKLGGNDVQVAISRIGSLVSTLERQLAVQIKIRDSREPLTRLQQSQLRVNLDKFSDRLKAAKAAQAEAEALKYARISPLAVSEKANQLMVQAGLQVRDHWNDEEVTA